MRITNAKEILRNAFKNRPFPLQKPVVIQFPVIDICNSRCQMCKIWENKQSTDISVEQLKIGLSNGLFSEVKSIGFNGGEPTLRKDLIDLVKVTIESLPSLKSISLITNAYKYQDVIQQVDDIGKIAKASGKFFDLMVSLDGYGGVHDRVRGKPGNFKRAQHVIEYAKNSSVVDNLRIGCTVIRENVFNLSELLDYCIENDLYIKYRQGVPHQRLYTENLLEPYALTFEEKYEFVEFLEGLIRHYEHSYMQNHFYRSLIGQIIDGAPRKAGCDWKYRGATITSKGELAYCAVKSKALMSNIWKGDPEKTFFANTDHLDHIVKNECDSCHHDYVGVPDRGDYFKYLLNRISLRFDLRRRLEFLPGFSKLKNIRAKNRFQKLFSEYKALPRSISLADKGSSSGAKKVMICGWYGTETLGDKAIVAGIISTTRSAIGPDVDITVASLYPYVTEMTRRQMAEFDGVNVIGVKDAIKTVVNQQYLLFGGGPMMAINELASMHVLFERARDAGVKTIAASVGVGPFGHDWLNSCIGDLLKLCDVRIYRDNRSLQNAKKLGVDVSDDSVAEDPAFTWISGLDNRGSSRDSQAPAANSKTLLLGLRDFPFREYARHLDESESIKVRDNYEHSVVKALEKLVEEDPSWIIKPLPMCTNHFGGDDRWFYRRLFRSNKRLLPFLDYSLLGRELPPSEYTKFFFKADLLLGMRFHSVVFGLGFGIKTVAIDYTMGKGKVHALSEDYGVLTLGMSELNPQGIHSALHQVSNGDTGQVKVLPHTLKFPGALRDALGPEVAN